ncbi:MAG: hypothetical protein CMJ81_03410 [Planctomycetaceae bacterium]|nr:hypothetical protein [Planctomycetaceae bacterium]MBP60120.1 hypothetical protein [Planctomycetaceae bacterium]
MFYFFRQKGFGIGVREAIRRESLHIQTDVDVPDELAEKKTGNSMAAETSGIQLQLYLRQSELEKFKRILWRNCWASTSVYGARIVTSFLEATKKLVARRRACR